MPHTPKLNLELTEHSNQASPLEKDVLMHSFELTAQVVANVAPEKHDAFHTYELGVVVTDDKEVTDLNTRYRDKPKTTDVLSFGWYEEGDSKATGDIVLSLPQVVRQAPEYHNTLKFEFAFLVIHGILHLWGYEDDTDEKRSQMIMLGEQAIAKLLPDDTSKNQEPDGTSRNHN